MNTSKKLLCMLSVSVLSLTVMSIGVQANSGRHENSSGLQQAIGKVEGMVVDQNGEPLIGVSVVIDGTTIGTTTDIDGKYSLNVKDNNANLIFSYVGHKTKIVPANKSVINVTMEEDTQLMDEVVVIGYGVMKKSDVTGAISSVKADAITRQPTSNVAQSLQGLVAGVTVTSNSGAPGGSVAVRVRGIGTVNNSDPLYVVDGMPVSNIDYLSSSDIQSMEILKDASATAIYGARGANGVVLITTKQGKAGKTTVTLDAYWGASKILNNLDLMSGSEWYGLEVAKGLNVDDFTNKYHLSQNTSTDWMKEITRTAAIQSYSVGISGGMADEYTYNTAVNYINQEGTIKKTDYERISIRQNVEKTIVKKILSVGTNLSITQSKENRILEGSNTVGIVNSAIKLEPVVPVKDKDGKYGFSPYQDYNNPVADIEFTNNKRKIFNLVGNMYGDLNIVKGLKLRSSFGAEIRKTDDYQFLPVYEVSSYQKNPVNQVTRGYRKYNYYVWENTLSYIKTFAEKHNINAVIGYTNEWGRTETLQGVKKNTPNDTYELQYLDAAQTGDAATGTAWESSLISYLGRVNYDFDDRYLITASIRHDGSSRFGSDHKYGTFPSAALGWKISNEEFFKNMNANWISSLKLRAGWGRIGNQNIKDYMYQNLLTNLIQYSYLYGTPKEILNQGIVAIQLGNKSVKWESTESTNIGLDANLLDGRLTFSGEYYYKKTKDMLIVEPLPNYMGYENGPLTNVGSATNQGVEFTVDWRDHVGDFNYNVGFNISTIRNRMTSLGDGGTPMVGGAIRNGNATYTRIGYPIGAFYGYKTEGLIQNAEQLAEVRKLQPNAELGDVIFANTNGDNALNDKDKTMIGNPIPDFIYGINLGASYKGFDLNIQIGGTYGNDIFNAMRYFTYDLASMTNKDRKMLNYWTPENTNTDVPRLAKVDTNDNKRISDRYVEDGSYLRLRNVQLGYTLPISLTRKAYMQKVRFYVTGQNLLTFTSYSGADPEVGQIDSDNYLSRGVDLGTYPQAMTITGGVSITF
ncbi:TonB-dependent receptor [Dysgonomonas sp. Marseille-P4677]|uniref:SusC/RagA family TonB-linked outer membrane protein n=1 Tax=Dysgonomonas sp. Marseille-P4677 TaxID=2364790 RepID=UPI00191179D2|nr:TonB-dependent receptor [Dysgonomonas sp. Marseille-P4677]MBK5721580.1 TonB-dependent receptor [Dysgonomonas sp. Marseille-P4677]